MAPPAAEGGPGGVRGWLIRKLGGTPAPPAPGNPYSAIPPAPSSYLPPGGPATPPIGPPGAPSSVPGWQTPSSVQVSPATPPFVPPYPQQSPPPPREVPPAPFEAVADDDDARTRFLGGVDLGKLKIPKQTFVLQILDISGQWRDWGPIHAGGINVGRARQSADFPGLSTMAVKHMKFRYDRTGLVVEDLGAQNGVYLRITAPTRLEDGMRFRVGLQTIEFHEAGPFEMVPPMVSDEGEEYCSRDLVALAFLDMIRPDGRPGLRFPITRSDPTIIGREGLSAHIALTGDNAVSGKHAQIRHESGRFLLEDLGSRNGTFVHVLGTRGLISGDVLLAGRVLFRVVDQSGG